MLRFEGKMYVRRPPLSVRQAMLMAKRKPATFGEVLVEEFMKPMGLTQGALADAIGVQCKHVVAG
jgi:hypothetical protein